MNLPLRFSIACLLSSCLCYAGQHPTRIENSSNCLECHADHATGTHIHPAVKGGCTSCHAVENRQDESNVVLKRESGILCFECHEATPFQYAHLPYASGMCTRCHDPHGAENPRLLRAKVNEVCLTCHLRTGETVPSTYLPSIILTSDHRRGHPYERHPVSGFPDPLTGEEMSCLSCHRPHGGGQLHLLKMGAEIPEDALNQNTETKDMCRKCHLRLWGLEGATSPNKRDKKAK